MGRDAITTMVDPDSDKVVINGLEGFRILAGRRIGTSDPVEVTQEKIEAFCRSVGNMDWMHWDEARCKQASFGTTIAPAIYPQAWFSSLWLEMVDIRNIKSMFFAGSDRMRVHAPIKCGSRFTMTVLLDHVEEKDLGIAVYLNVIWNVLGEEKPAATATYLLRYA